MRGERKTSNSMNRDVDDVKIIKFYFKTTYRNDSFTSKNICSAAFDVT